MHLGEGRIQQIVGETAKDIGSTKRVYPHLLQCTIAQHLNASGVRGDLIRGVAGLLHGRVRPI